MSNDTLTRADLTEAVFQAVGLSRTDSANPSLLPSVDDNPLRIKRNFSA